MLKWGQGMIVDHEGFVLTPSSPVMDPGRYEYQADLPSKCCYKAIFLQVMRNADGCIGVM